MKKNYIKQIEEELNKYVIDHEEKQDIIDDYNDMYQEYLEQGMSEDEIETKLGNPKLVVKDLTKGYNKVTKTEKGTRLIALSPFVATIVFFLSGMIYNAWEVAWMAFLLIPITAISVSLYNEKNKNIINGLTPFIAIIIFFILGYFYNLWHPAWIVFMIIPLTAITLQIKEIGVLNVLIATSPIIAAIVFVFLGLQGQWVPGWTVFLVTPFIAILHEKNKVKVVIFEMLLLSGLLGYLYIGYEMSTSWNLALLSFVPVVGYSVMTGYITIQIGEKKYWYAVLSSIVGYVLLGLLFQNWLYTLIVFTVIPMTAILFEVKGKDKYIALSPFVTTILFITFGAVFNIWEYIWLVYLGIPMTAIILTVDNS